MLAEEKPNGAENSLKKARFGRFLFDLASEELWRDDTPVPLRPRAALALRLLVSRAGEIVGREELRSALWGTTIMEWQDGLHQIIRELRKALGDDSQRPRFIETVNRRGYRFCAALEPDRLPLGSDGNWPRVRPRELLIFGGGALSVPALVLVACVAFGIGT